MATLSRFPADTLVRALEIAHADRRALDDKIQTIASKIIDGLCLICCDDDCSVAEPDPERFAAGCALLVSCSSVLYTLAGTWAGPHPDNPANHGAGGELERFTAAVTDPTTIGSQSSPTTTTNGA